MRFRLPIPRHKVVRLIFPSCLFFLGLTIFICGLVRTYHIGGTMVNLEAEEKTLMARNEYVEWWLGLPLMACSILAVVAVLLDIPLQFKISVVLLGIVLILLFSAFMVDAGEYAWTTYDVKMFMMYKNEGYTCETKQNNYTYDGHRYDYRECSCMKDKKFASGFWVNFSCEILFALYYVYMIQSFAVACSLALCLFTMLSFVLILKRISQITTALHLDEKPLSDDFANIQGDLYVES